MKMGSNTQTEEEYIDMEMIPSSNLLCYTIRSTPQSSRDFEFQMCTSLSNDSQTTTSPADELFYKGKLLPLHLPPRLQMVQTLLHDPAPTSSSVTTPPDSRRVSNELTADEYFFEWSTELTGFISASNVKKPMSKRVTESYLTRKLKSSTVFLTSLFVKSGCAVNNETEAKTAKRDCLMNYMKVIRRKKQSCRREYCEEMRDNACYEECFNGQRRSFSGAIHLHSTSSTGSSSGSSSSSSSFSMGWNGVCDMQFLKRSSSGNSEIESSIQGAIAHCKKSQQQRQALSGRKTIGKVCSLSSEERSNRCNV